MAEDSGQVELEPGAVLSGTYRIVRRIAEGGMGVVYEGRHLRLTERRVAIKVLLEKRAPDSEMAQRFRREAEICSRLEHPHIVSVTDWDTLPDGSSFFVMEYLDGESLGSRMDRGRIPPRRVFEILRQIGLALEAAHREGVIHRDLKPNNVFLVDTGDRDETFVKVLDFGISKIMSDATLKRTESTIIGSPRFMSPEQARGRNDEIDERSDQFSLAVMAYAMFSDEPPFASDTLESTLYNIVHEEPRPLDQLVPDLPRHAIAAINQAMSKSPAHRFPSVTAFVRTLQGELPLDTDEVAVLRKKLVAAPTVDSKPAVPDAATVDLRPPPRQPAPSRLPWFLLAAVLVLGALGAGLSFLLRAGDGQAADAGMDARVAVAAVRQDTGAPATAPDAGAASSSGDADSPIEEDPRDAGREKIRVSQKPEVSMPVEPGAAARLAEAETQFNQGNHRKAIRLARKSIIVQDTPAARKLIALGYCALKDLSNAKASLFKVAPVDRKQVIQRCRELGLGL